MEKKDKEIFTNIFLGKIPSGKRVDQESVHGALMEAAGMIISPLVKHKDVPIYCTQSIVDAINEKRSSDVAKLLERVVAGIEDNIKERKNKIG